MASSQQKYHKAFVLLIATNPLLFTHIAASRCFSCPTYPSRVCNLTQLIRSWPTQRCITTHRGMFKKRDKKFPISLLEILKTEGGDLDFSKMSEL